MRPPPPTHPLPASGQFPSQLLFPPHIFHHKTVLGTLFTPRCSHSGSHSVHSPGDHDVTIACKDLGPVKAGVPNLWAADRYLWSDQQQQQIRHKAHNQCKVLESSPNHPSPCFLVRGKIVSREMGPWGQKVGDHCLWFPTQPPLRSSTFCCGEWSSFIQSRK